MAKYRKKPVVVEANRWWQNGDHPEDGEEIFTSGEFEGQKYEGKVVRYFRRPYVPGHTSCKHCYLDMHVHGWIDTLEGGHIVCPGDWIITGISNEKYPCKPDIFEDTYEPVEEDKMDKLSASEAVYGFAGWLTSQDEPITASSTHDAGIWAEKVDEFCKANNLECPKDGWEKNLKHPVEEEQNVEG